MPLDPLLPNPMDLRKSGRTLDAGLQANPGHRESKPSVDMEVSCQTHLNPDSDDDDTQKIPPPIFKGSQEPDAHICATEDWMEAIREDQYIDKFKHTLNHLAQE